MKSLQSLRFIFAMMIFFHHVPDETGIGIFSAGGSCAVSFFFYFERIYTGNGVWR